MLGNLLKGLVDIVYPKACIACKKKISLPSVDDIVCLGCWGKIKRNTPPFCRRCGRQMKGPGLLRNICKECIKRPLSFDRAFSACAYEGVVKELIHEFKYKGKDYLGGPLSRLMVEFIKEYTLPVEYIDHIIPMPLHQTRLREREFNQARLLSGNIGLAFDKKVMENNLIRRRHTKAQADLDADERLLNVKGSFSVAKKELLKGKNILLIDDVLTTGATSSEAALTLKEAGAAVVFVLTLAS